MAPVVTLVIPCYNEASNLESLFEKCVQLCADGSIEVLIVDNGSTDQSQTVMERLKNTGAPGIRFTRISKNIGYGHGILAGLKLASTEYIGWTHADLQTNPMDVLLAIEAIEQESEPLFVKGFRKNRPWGDKVFSLGMELFESALLRQHMREINAQPTIFHRSLSDSWGEAPNDFALDLFAYYRARKSALKVVRIPVRFPPRQHGTSTWNTGMRAKVKMIRRIISFSLDLANRELR